MINMTWIEVMIISAIGLILFIIIVTNLDDQLAVSLKRSAWECTAKEEQIFMDHTGTYNVSTSCAQWTKKEK